MYNFTKFTHRVVSIIQSLFMLKHIFLGMFREVYSYTIKTLQNLKFNREKLQLVKINSHYRY